MKKITIYKITNNINSKVYIGQSQNLTIRIRQHELDCKRDYRISKFYKAINKYGWENFLITVIEEVDPVSADEREIYWVEYYNSFNNGYNSTLGGTSVRKIQITEEEIIEKYKKLKSARKTDEFFNLGHGYTDKIINKNHVYRYSKQEQIHSSKIAIKKENTIKTFNTFRETANWLIENNESTSSSIEHVRKEVSRRLKEKLKYNDWEIYFLKE